MRYIERFKAGLRTIHWHGRYPPCIRQCCRNQHVEMFADSPMCTPPPYPNASWIPAAENTNGMIQNTSQFSGQLSHSTKHYQILRNRYAAPHFQAHRM